ncbi:MAG: PEPxxWA-CTERM sorting domain-containing protein [Sandarakinorhabdus sp.]|nr:PEPxxWA-CTERM sorting domain-containing protein [Sandarakinorhabdus sp.]
MREILVAALLFSASAAGAVGYSSSPGAPDPGVGPGETIIDSFSTGMVGPAGIVYSGSYTVDALAIGGIRAAPAGDATAYFATPGSASPTPGTATIDFSGFISANNALQSLSFYWGSIDGYNTLEVLDKVGNVIKTLVGSDISPANGDQSLPATNRRLFLTFAPTDNFAALRLTSTSRAFEIDDIAAKFDGGGGTGNTVPEPASWTLLISGFALVGFASRRQRRIATVSC